MDELKSKIQIIYSIDYNFGNDVLTSIIFHSQKVQTFRQKRPFQIKNKLIWRKVAYNLTIGLQRNIVELEPILNSSDLNGTVLLL